MCHTILPSRRTPKRDIISMTEESLAVEFDFNKPIDVQKAVARLTPFEQKVVRAIGLGNESLESFSESGGYSTWQIRQTWLEAKVKLQEYLDEYKPRPSKRTVHIREISFKTALQAIEKQQ